MPLYVVRQTAPYTFEVAKFSDNKFPLEVYDVIRSDCNCPSPKVPCKHAAIVKAWLQQPIPHGLAFDPEAEMFIRFVDPKNLDELMENLQL